MSLFPNHQFKLFQHLSVFVKALRLFISNIPKPTDGDCDMFGIKLGEAGLDR